MPPSDSKNPANANVAQLQDWFLPAILSDGTVRESLDAVRAKLQRKKNFVEEITIRLCPSESKFDRITAINRETKELENTLRFRLSMLNVERSQSWFKEAANGETGPFRATVLLAPVFATYRRENVAKIKKCIYDLWTNNQAEPLPFAQQPASLWSTLLCLNAKLEQLCQLGPHFPKLRLDQLPDGLPEDLDTRSLRAFLLNVKHEIGLAKDLLNLCFDQLWTASDKFWTFQEEQLRQSTKQTNSSTNQQQERKFGGNHTNFDTLGLGFEDVQALRFMGFQKRPDKAELRRRYLELAKKFHPDRAGGNGESFKLLNKAYNRLLSIV